MTYLERRAAWRGRQVTHKISMLDMFGEIIDHQTLSADSNPALLGELGNLHDCLAERPDDVQLPLAIRAATQLPPTDSCFLLDSIRAKDEQALHGAFSEIPEHLRERLTHMVHLISKADIFLEAFSPTALSTIHHLVSNHAQAKTA